MKFLLSKGFDPNVQGREHGCSPLHLAVKKNNEMAVCILTQHATCDVNLKVCMSFFSLFVWHVSGVAPKLMRVMTVTIQRGFAFLSGLERVIFQLQVHCIFFFTFSFFSVRASISLMVNDIAAVSPMNNLLVKYADDITISVPVRQSTDTAAAEVEYMKKWADINEMSLNFTKTWEMCMHGKTTKLSPPELPGIKRKSWLKLLGVTFQEDVTNWDIHIDNMLSKASSRIYILRVCKSYGYSKDQLNNLFNSLVMSVFLYGIEVWGAAYQRKYLDRIDRFLKRAHRFGFVTKKTTILDLIKDRDSKLFKNVIRDDHILHDLLPPKRKRVLRERKHDFIFPRVRTERFKQNFLNRCIFY